MISEASLERTPRGARARAGGGRDRSLCGGARVGDRGWFLAPTVVEGAARDAWLSCTELFGPVTALYRVRDLDEAIEVVNDSPYGLTAAIHTASLHRAMRFAEEARAGVVVVNGGTHGSEPHMGFGGVKGSGHGLARGRRRGARRLLGVEVRQPRDGSGAGVTVAVLGPGAVGGSLAVRLARAGRARRLRRAARDGGADRARRADARARRRGAPARPEAAETLAEPVDLLLVDGEGAVPRRGARARRRGRRRSSCRSSTGSSTWPCSAAASPRCAPRRSAGSRPGARARRGSSSAPRRLVTMCRRLAPRAARARRRRRPARRERRADVLWEKLARQGPLALLTAATGRTMGELRADPRLRAAVAEACAVAAADGASTTFAEPVGASSSPCRPG